MSELWWWYFGSVVVAFILAKAWNKAHIPYDHIPLSGVLMWPLYILGMILDALNKWMHD